MRLLLKASEEKEHFHDLIYKDVTFASDIMSIGGQITYRKGPDIYVQPKISTFKINGIPSTCWRPETFVEFKTNINDTTEGNAG